MATIYESSIPIISHKLGNLKHIVQLGAKHVAEHDLDESALTAFRLFPDMLPFSKQITIPTDIVCGATARLTGNDRLSLRDGTATFDELIARIDACMEHLNNQSSEDYTGAESKQITLQTPAGDLSFTGSDYLAHFVFPNLYFHITTAYNILRHNGVALGKSDYLRGAGTPAA